MVSENAEIDRRIKYINLADDIEPMVKFNPGIGLEAEPDRIRIQISLLGENGNPFELYRLLTRFIQSEDEILGKVKQMACYGISLLSSKLLSVGALLTEMENENEVAIYNVIIRDYVIDKDNIDFDELNKKSTTFLMWIKGDAYND